MIVEYTVDTLVSSFAQTVYTRYHITYIMDMQKVRASFPALSQDLVFFDNAGGSQILGSVIDS